MSKPNKKGSPTAIHTDSDSSTSRLDTVFTKLVAEHSHLQVDMNERLRSLVKAKLWRMGQALSRCNSQQKQRLLNKWKESEWVVSLKPLEIKSSLCKERARLSEEVACLQTEKKKLEAGVSAVKADAIDMERKVCVLESELANEKDKVKGLEHVDLPSLFPELSQVKTVQEIWMKFLSLNECIKSQDLSSAQIPRLAEDAKQWLSLLTGVSNKACDTLHACTSVPPSGISKNTRNSQPLHSTRH